MALVKHAAFTRFRGQQKTWISMQAKDLREQYTKTCDEAMETLYSIGGLSFHTAETFDDLFLLQPGAVCLDLPGAFWVRGVHPADRGKRGWWQIKRPKDDQAGQAVMVFDDTIVSAKMFGPLACGLVLVVEGNVREVIRRWA